MSFSSLRFAKFLVFTSFLTACLSAPTERWPAQVSRERSQINKSIDEVAVYLEGQEVKYIQGPTSQIFVKSASDTEEINKISQFVIAHKNWLQVQQTTPLELKVLNVLQRSSQTIVRFQQIIQRQVNGRKYIIPIESASLVATLQDNRLSSLVSELKNPPSIQMIFQRPGFDTRDFSERQMSTLVSYLKASADQQSIRNYLTNIATNSQINFNFDQFLTEPPERQLRLMRIFFLQIKSVSTAKIIIELAQEQKLALVQHGNEWLFQVTEFLGLPIQFDIVIPNANQPNQRLRVKNLRDLYRNARLDIYSQKDFPGGNKELKISWDLTQAQPSQSSLADTSDLETAQLFFKTTEYFKTKHKWLGLDGISDSSVISVVKNISVPPLSENAFWYKQGGFLGIGIGGTSLHNLHRSASTLAHEYTHAIIDNSSHLVYAGESGGLNEHFADVIGIDAEAFINNHSYDFTIGEDVLTNEFSSPQKEVIAEKLKSGEFKFSDIQKFSLGEVAIRNIYYPPVSLYPQQSHMNEALKEYGPQCQPSVDNDNCGVHSTAGIPSKAVSRIISDVGIDKTRSVFFNTMTYRLGAHASFQEYLRQLHEECLISPQLNPATDCPLMIQRFAEVGILYPDKKSTPPLPLLSGLQRICGKPQSSQVGAITIINNKADPRLILPHLANQYQGQKSLVTLNELNIIKSANCICLDATLQPVQDSKGTWLYLIQKVQTLSVKVQPYSVCEKIN